MRDEGLLAVGADRRICPIDLTGFRADTAYAFLHFSNDYRVLKIHFSKNFRAANIHFSKINLGYICLFI